MYDCYIIWTSIIRDIYFKINNQKKKKRKLNKINKLKKKEKTSYGVTSCQNGNDSYHYKFYLNEIGKGKILDGRYSREIFINNPYITSDLNYPNLIFFDIVPLEIKKIEDYIDKIKSIQDKFKINYLSTKIDLHFTLNEKFKVHQYLPNKEFIFIDNIIENNEKIQKIINLFKEKIIFIQIKNIDYTNSFKFFDNVKILDSILTFREMLYFISFSKCCFLNDLDLLISHSNKIIVNSDFLIEDTISKLDKILENTFFDAGILFDNYTEILNDNITKGKQSIVEMFKINDNIKNQIEEKINYKISNVIVKKTYIDVEYKKKISKDNCVIYYMGGKFEQMKREVRSLKKLYKKDHFPILLGVDYKNFCIYMNNCGTTLSSNNLPSNWNIQINEINNSLKTCNIFNNDFWINNILVNENKLYLIDFGYSSCTKPEFPFLNLNSDKICKIKNFIDYLKIKILEENDKKQKFKNFFINIYNESNNQYKNSINCFEDLHIINGNRPTEIHTIIAWDGKNDYLKTKDYCKNLPSNFKIVYEKIINLKHIDQISLINSIYYKNAKNRIKNNSIYLIVIEDSNPMYTYEKATKCWQVLNKNMKLIKEDLRINVGGSIKNYGSIHTSYNVEESLLVLEPLNLKNLIKRPKFKNFKQLFDFLNNDKLLKYVVIRSFFELEYSTKDYGTKKDVDVIVNDYYYFKSITGARADIKYKTNMRENDNGYNSLNTINIGEVEIRFDIRYVGDNYFDSEWERDVLNRRINYQLKENLNIFIPCLKDELYSLIYNIIIQKPNPEKNKHIPRVNELLGNIKLEKLDFKDYNQVLEFLNKFLNENYYNYKKPFDKSVNFYLR